MELTNAIKRKIQNNFAVETKNMIKDKIDALESLRKEGISMLVGMITGLHGNLRTWYSEIPSYSTCPRCGNEYPEGSAFCNGCGFKIR